MNSISKTESKNQVDLVVSLATGHEDGEKVTLAFLVATAALNKGMQALMFLTKEAVRIGTPGYAEAIEVHGAPPVSRLIGQYEEAGGTFLVCPICFDARRLEANELRPSAELGGATPLMDRLGPDTKTFSF